MNDQHYLGLFPLRPGDIVRDDRDEFSDHVIYSLGVTAAGLTIITGLSLYDRSLRTWEVSTYDEMGVKLIRKNIRGMSPEQVQEHIEKNVFGKVVRASGELGQEDILKFLYSEKGSVFRDLLLIGDSADLFEKDMVELASALVNQTKRTWTAEQIYKVLSKHIDLEEIDVDFLRGFSSELAERLQNYLIDPELAFNLNFRLKYGRNDELDDLLDLIQRKPSDPPKSATRFQSVLRLNKKTDPLIQDSTRVYVNPSARKLVRDYISGAKPIPAFDDIVREVKGLDKQKQALGNVLYHILGLDPTSKLQTNIPVKATNLSDKDLDVILDTPIGSKLYEAADLITNQKRFLYQTRRATATKQINTTSLRGGLSVIELESVALRNPKSFVSLETSYFINNVLKNKRVTFTSASGQNITGRANDPRILYHLLDRLQITNRTSRTPPRQQVVLPLKQLTKILKGGKKVNLDRVLREHENLINTISETSLDSLQSVHGNTKLGFSGSPAATFDIVDLTEERIKEQLRILEEPEDDLLKLFVAEQGGETFVTSKPTLFTSPQNIKQINIPINKLPRPLTNLSGLVKVNQVIQNSLGQFNSTAVSFTNLIEDVSTESITDTVFDKAKQTQKIALAPLERGKYRLLGTSMGSGVEQQVTQIRNLFQDPNLSVLLSDQVVFMDLETLTRYDDINDVNTPVLRDVGIITGKKAKEILDLEGSRRNLSPEEIHERNKRLSFVKSSSNLFNVKGYHKLKKGEKKRQLLKIIKYLEESPNYVITQTNNDWKFLRQAVIDLRIEGTLSPNEAETLLSTLIDLETTKGIDFALVSQFIPGIDLSDTKQETTTRRVFGVGHYEAHESIPDTLDMVDVLRESAGTVGESTKNTTVLTQDSLRRRLREGTVVVPNNTMLSEYNGQPLEIIDVIDSSDGSISLRAKVMVLNEQGLWVPTNQQIAINAQSPSHLWSRLGRAEILTVDKLNKNKSVISGSREVLETSAARMLRALNPFAESVYTTVKPGYYGPFDTRKAWLTKHAISSGILEQTRKIMEEWDVVNPNADPNRRLDRVKEVVDQFVTGSISKEGKEIPEYSIKQFFTGIPYSVEDNNFLLERAQNLQNTLKEVVTDYLSNAPKQQVIDKSSYRDFLDSRLGAEIGKLNFGYPGVSDIDPAEFGILLNRRMFQEIYEGEYLKTTKVDPRISFGFEPVRRPVRVTPGSVGTQGLNAFDESILRLLMYADLPGSDARKILENIFTPDELPKLTERISRLKEQRNIPANLEEYGKMTSNSAEDLAASMGGWYDQDAQILNEYRFRIYRDQNAAEYAMGGLIERIQGYGSEEGKEYLLPKLEDLRKRLSGIDSTLDNNQFIAQFRNVFREGLDNIFSEENAPYLDQSVEEIDWERFIHDVNDVDKPTLQNILNRAVRDQQIINEAQDSSLILRAQQAAQQAGREIELNQNLSNAGRMINKAANTAFDNVLGLHSETLEQSSEPTKGAEVTIQHKVVSEATQGATKSKNVSQLHQLVLQGVGLDSAKVFNKVNVPLMAIGGALALLAAKDPRPEESYIVGNQTRNIGPDNLGLARNAEIPGSKTFPLVFVGQETPFKIDITLKGMVKSEAEKEKVVTQVFNVLNNTMEFRKTTTDVRDKRERNSNLDARDLLRRRL
jgi:hypothetical protein